MHALCWPLLLAADGTKLGKTTGARVWLDPARTSPYAFFQHWMDTPDELIHRQLAQFTLLEMDEVDAVAAAHAEAPHRRAGQRRLALEASGLVHGPDQAAVAAEAADILFGGDPRTATPAALATVAAEVQGTSLEAGESLADGVDLVPVLVRSGLASSQSEGRRQLDQRGIAVNGDKVDPVRRLGPEDLLGGRYILLRRGKKDWAVLDTDPT